VIVPTNTQKCSHIDYKDKDMVSDHLGQKTSVEAITITCKTPSRTNNQGLDVARSRISAIVKDGNSYLHRLQRELSCCWLYESAILGWKRNI
jgi:hypothetical protein